MQLRVSQKFFCQYCFCIVYAVHVAMTSHKTGVSLSRLSCTFFKIYHKIFNSSKLVNFFYLKIAQVLLIPKTNFLARESRILKGNGWKHRDIVGKMSVFPKAPPISLIFLWVLIHFIAVIYCILNLTNYFREDW